jgi:hypothetical protein
MAKNKSDAKGKKAKGDKKAKRAAGGISVAGHPRAAAQVRRAKGFGGVTFFLIAAYLSYRAQVPPDQVALRALIGGIGGYLLTWMCAVTVWRHLVLAELRAAIESGRARMEPATPSGTPAVDAQAPDGGRH